MLPFARRTVRDVIRPLEFCDSIPSAKTDFFWGITSVASALSEHWAMDSTRVHRTGSIPVRFGTQGGGRYSRLKYFEPVFYEPFIKRIDSQVNAGVHRPEGEMKIQVNSDKTIAVDAGLIRFVEGEVRPLLGRFAIRLTRAEIHLSDVDNTKRGQPDKRCLIAVRPTGARPLSASGQATKTAYAVSHALGKIQRSLTTFFGRRGRLAAASSTPVPAGKKVAPSKASLGPKGVAEVKKVAFEKPTK